MLYMLMMICIFFQIGIYYLYEEELDYKLITYFIFLAPKLAITEVRKGEINHIHFDAG